MRTLLGQRQIFGRSTFVFRVSTRERGNVFMRVDRTGSESSPRAVVEIDAAKFLALWRAHPSSPHREVSSGNPSTWVQDYKFHDAEDGFRDGESNPVPLADVGCHIDRAQRAVYERRLKFFKRLVGYETVETPCAGFTDGVTRTIWLMAYGATHFPVSCEAADAPLLQKMAGLPGGRVKLVSELGL